MFCGAIIVAGGSGERLGADVPKGFIELCGKTLIERSVAAFADLVEGMVVVVPSGWEDRAEGFLRPFGNRVKIIAGGKTRTESVRRGFAELDRGIDVVAIHDAARPLVERGDIIRAFDAAKASGAAALAIPVTDTLKVVEGDYIVRTLAREGLWAVQTPQVFERGLLERALAATDGDATDDCALVEAMGGKIRIVLGKRTNIKITYPDDLALAEALLKMERRNR